MDEHGNGQTNMSDNDTREELKKFRDEINDSIKNNQKARDQMILAISVALFGLMSFLMDKLQTTCCFQVLVFLLLVFNLVSLLATLLSFHCSEKGSIEDFRLYEQQIECNKYCSQHRYSRWTLAGRLCNKISSICMALTLVFLAMTLFLHFSTKPQPQEVLMKKTESSTTNSSPQNPPIGVGKGNESSDYGIEPIRPKKPQQDCKDSGDTTNKGNNDKKQ